jgi:hypothetical protein
MMRIIFCLGCTNHARFVLIFKSFYRFDVESVLELLRFFDDCIKHKSNLMWL